MNHSRFAHTLFSLLLISISFSSLAHAEDSEVQLLRKEVRELNKTVQQLIQMVGQQNKRIDELAGKPSVEPSNPQQAIEPVVKQEEKPAIQTAEQTKAEKSSPVITPAPQSSDQEVQSLLNTVNNAPPLPGSQSHSVGLWKYPTGSSPAAKILPDISVIGTFAGAYFSKEPRGDVLPNPNRTGFTFQELELALTGTVDQFFKYDAFLSFGEEGVEAEEAYFTTLEGPPRGLSFRGGKFLLPFGRQNQKHLHAWAFADNNLVNNYFLGTDNLGELGLEIAYLFPTPFFMQLQGTFTNSGGDASFGGTNKGEFLYNGRLSTSFDITNDLTMLIGASGAFGYNDTGGGGGVGNTTKLAGADLLLKWKPSAYTGLIWQTEYIFRDKGYNFGGLKDGGLYSYLDYQFYKQYHAELRYDQMGLPSGVFNSEWRFTPAFTYNPTEFSQIRVQYEVDKRQGFPVTQAAILQFMFVLGVHGAHLF